MEISKQNDFKQKKTERKMPKVMQVLLNETYKLMRINVISDFNHLIIEYLKCLFHI